MKTEDNGNLDQLKKQHLPINKTTTKNFQNPKTNL